MNAIATSEVFARIESKLQSDMGDVKSTREFFRSFSDTVQDLSQALSKASYSLSVQSLGQSENPLLSSSTKPFIEFLTGIVSNFCLLVQQIDTEIISPLGLFEDNIRSSVHKLLESSVQKQKDFLEAKASLMDTKNTYFEAFEVLNHREKTINKQLFNKARDAYLNRIEIANQTSSQFFDDINKNIKMLDDIEETRTNFLQMIHEKYSKLSQDFFHNYKRNIKKEEHKIVPQYFRDSPLAILLKYSSNLKEYFIDNKIYEHCPDLIANYLFNLVEEENMANFCLLQEIVKDHQYRKVFLINLYSKLANPECKPSVLIYLSILFIDILSSDISKDAESFQHFLSVCCSFYCTINGKKMFIIDFLLNIRLLQNKNKWVQVIERKMNLLISKESPNKFMSSLFRDKSQKQKMAYLVCYEYKYFIHRARLSLEMATDIILEVTKRAKLDDKRIGHILTDFMVLLKPPMKIEASRKNSKAAHKWGYLLPIAQSLPYLKWNDLQNIILVCKNWNLAFKHKIISLELTRLTNHSGFNDSFRRYLWSKVLNNNLVNYGEDLQKVQEETIADYGKVIEQDIERSYRHEVRVSPEAQKNILTAIAQSFPNVGYCQGMNYLSGFLYLIYQDEPSTYQAFVGLLKNLKMERCLNKDMSNSIVLFYKIDRLVSMLLPDLHEILVDNSLSAVYYASPWILTAFVYVLQGRTDILLKVWDYFLAKGWKALIRMTFLILKLKKTALLDSSSDFFMKTLTEFDGELLCKLECNLIEQLENIPISNKLLRELEAEFYEVNKLSST